jgi:hypothetical protein
MDALEYKQMLEREQAVIDRLNRDLGRPTSKPTSQAVPECIEVCLMWLKAALDCENFPWDADQHEAALAEWENAKAWLAASPTPDHQQQGENK